jgi:hypothetical protein
MKKPSNTGAALKTRTASWQYDSMTLANGMDNDSNHPSYKQLKKFSGNQHGGAAEGNFGRGPTVGNRSDLDIGPKSPPVSAVPAFEKARGPSDSINYGGQVRTPGGTRAWDPKSESNYRGNPDRINSGRGPTKGNAQ